MEIGVGELKGPSRPKAEVDRVENRRLAAVPGTDETVQARLGMPLQALYATEVLYFDFLIVAICLPRESTVSA
nr:hypothetical protein [Sinorhizobium medicae]